MSVHVVSIIKMQKEGARSVLNFGIILSGSLMSRCAWTHKCRGHRRPPGMAEGRTMQEQFVEMCRNDH